MIHIKMSAYIKIRLMHNHDFLKHKQPSRISGTCFIFISRYIEHQRYMLKEITQQKIPHLTLLFMQKHISCERSDSKKTPFRGNSHFVQVHPLEIQKGIDPEANPQGKCCNESTDPACNPIGCTATRIQILPLVVELNHTASLTEGAHHQVYPGGTQSQRIFLHLMPKLNHSKETWISTQCSQI